MRLLHTGDWHMNARLGHRSRAEEINASLQEIAGLLDAHDVEVMIVAGDLFRDQHMDKRETGDVVARIKTIFGKFLARQGTIVAITGNHDSEIACRTLRDTLALAPAAAHVQTGALPPGRLYIETEPKYMRLADRAGNIVQFVLMPYPNSLYLRGVTTQAVLRAARNAAIADKFKLALAHLTTPPATEELPSAAGEPARPPAFDESLPAVFVSHIHVRGVNPNAHTAYEVSEADDVIFEPGDIPAHFAYAAYGHIHDPSQKPAGPNVPHVRYCGSIQRLDAGERGDVKSVVVFDIKSGDTRSSKAQNILEIPLNAVTPLHEISVNAEAGDHDRLRELYPDICPERDLVKYSIVYTPGVHNIGDIERKVQDAFPCWYARRLAAKTQDTAPPPPPPSRDVEKNVRNYITARYEPAIAGAKDESARKSAEAERDSLQDLASALWRECAEDALAEEAAS